MDSRIGASPGLPNLPFLGGVHSAVRPYHLPDLACSAWTEIGREVGSAISIARMHLGKSRPSHFQLDCLRAIAHRSSCAGCCSSLNWSGWQLRLGGRRRFHQSPSFKDQHPKWMCL